MLVILLFSAITNGALLSSTSLTLQEIYLLHCLTYISHRYFVPGRTFVISSPASYRDVQQELIAEIHRTSIWPVVVTVDGNISKLNKTDFVDREDSYITLIPNGGFMSLHAEFQGLALRRGTFTKFWNSEARFFVAGANNFSTWQKKHIFHFFSAVKIYNCIIVNQEHYVTDKEYIGPIKVSDVDTAIRMGVYTWFPYQSSDRCTEVNDIILLDSWVISAQGHFTKNTDLFPRKISNSLKGCPKKTIGLDGHSHFSAYHFNQTNSDGSVVTYVAGLDVNLLFVVLK